jgi:hypothetical protein
MRSSEATPPIGSSVDVARGDAVAARRIDVAELVQKHAHEQEREEHHAVHRAAAPSRSQ